MGANDFFEDSLRDSVALSEEKIKVRLTQNGNLGSVLAVAQNDGGRTELPAIAPSRLGPDRTHCFGIKKAPGLAAPQLRI